MQTENGKTRALTAITKTIFFVAILTYLIGLLYHPQFAPTDDFTFLRTLQAGKFMLYYSESFPYYDSLSMGRFTPITGTEYNLAGLFARTPFAYYASHALQLLIFAFLFIALIQKATKRKWLAYAISSLLLLMPGFAISYFRMQMNERNVLLFLTAFLLLFIGYSEKRKWWQGAGILLLANLAIYYKETGFIAIGAFAVAHLAITIKEKRDAKQVWWLDCALIASSLFYLGIYLLIKARGVTFVLRNEGNIALTLVKNTLNYATFSDPLVAFLGVLLILHRIYRIFVKKDAPHVIFDSMLFAAGVYMSAFFALRMYGPYYFLPVYAFVIPALLHYLAQNSYKTAFWNSALAVTGAFVIMNAIPSGIHYITYYKYLPANFNDTLDFLIAEIRTHQKDSRARIFLDGVDLAGGRGTFFVFGQFLEYKGLSEKEFDLLSRTPTAAPEPLISNIQPRYTAITKDVPSMIKSGDYLVVTPQNTARDNSPAYIESLKEDFTLVHQTKSTFSFPSFTMKSLVKYFIAKMEKKSDGLVKSGNVFDRPDYYVFVKK